MNLDRVSLKLDHDCITGQPITPDRPGRYQQMTAFCGQCRDHTKHDIVRDQGEISWFCSLCKNLHSTMVRMPKPRERQEFKRPTLTKAQMREQINAALQLLHK